MVGDSPYDAIAARSGGMHAIGVLSGGFSEDRLRRAGASMVFLHLSELVDTYEASIFGRGGRTWPD